MIQLDISEDQIQHVSNMLAGIPKGAQSALKTAVQSGTSKVKTESVSEVTKVYAISAADVRANAGIRSSTRSSGDGVVGTVMFSGAKIPLYKFDISQKSPNKGKGFISARQLQSESRKKFYDGFVALMPTGHLGLYERIGLKRLPISEFKGSSVAQMVDNLEVKEEIGEIAQGTLNTKLIEAIDKILDAY